MSVDVGPLLPHPTVRQRLQQAEEAFNSWSILPSGARRQNQLGNLRTAVYGHQQIIRALVRKHPDVLDELA